MFGISLPLWRASDDELFDGVESNLMQLNYDLDLFALFKADLYSCS